MPSFSIVSQQRLETVHPLLKEICYDAIEIVDFVVICGHRNKVDQETAYRAGKSKLQWPNSKHNYLPSLAVDLAPYIREVSGKIDWNDLVAFGRLMGVIQSVAYYKGIRLRFGLDWDGDFRTARLNDPNESFFDAPHVELVL